jgi:hypothetical protein
MDAIHLATALTVREDLGAMFVYDTDLHATAQAHDLNPIAHRGEPITAQSKPTPGFEPGTPTLREWCSTS